MRARCSAIATVSPSMRCRYTYDGKDAAVASGTVINDPRNDGTRPRFMKHRGNPPDPLRSNLVVPHALRRREGVHATDAPFRPVRLVDRLTVVGYQFVDQAVGVDGDARCAGH